MVRVNPKDIAMEHAARFGHTGHPSDAFRHCWIHWLYTAQLRHSSRW